MGFRFVVREQEAPAFLQERIRRYRVENEVEKNGIVNRIMFRPIPT